MILMMFLSHSILDAGRFLPLGEDQIVSTIAQVFLHGVAGAKGSTAG